MDNNIVRACVWFHLLLSHESHDKYRMASSFRSGVTLRYANAARPLSIIKQ